MPPLKLEPPRHANRSMSLYTTASYENQASSFVWIAKVTDPIKPTMIPIKLHTNTMKGQK